MKTLTSLITILMILSLSAFGQEVEFKNPKIIEVGKISKGGIIEGTLDFVNNSGQAVEIEKIKPSCGCTTIEPDQLVYASGESGSIPYTIDTEKFNGVIQKSITIHFKDNTPAKQTFFIRANVVTDISISPRFINFQNVEQNADTTLTEFFEIENESDQAIEIVSIYTKSPLVKVVPESVEIPAGKSHLIRLELVPSEPGRHNAQILISANHTKEKEKKIPVFVNVVSPVSGSR